MLKLEAFGVIDVRNATGEPLAAVLGQPKRAALLAYLVLAHPGGFHRRDSLLAMFWPELDQSHGRAALSQALSFLRRELDSGILVTRGVEEVGVDPGRVESDVGAFEEALTREDWAGALEVYKGDLLEGLHVSGSAPFIDWVDRERERLREAAAGAAWRRAHQLLNTGEPTEAERIAQRALYLVPTDETLVRAFIEAMVLAGDRAAAVRFYERFARILEQELGVEPAPETTATLDGAREASGRRADPERSTDGAERVARVASQRRPVPETGTPHSSASTSPPALSAAPHARGGSMRKGWLAGAAAVVLIVLAGHVFVRQGRTGGPDTLIRQGLAAKNDQVMVADFAAADALLGSTATEWLRTKLDESDIVRPVERAAIASALRRMEMDATAPVDEAIAHEIAIRDGYPLVVAGEIERAGDGYLLTARLESTRDGKVLGRFRAHAPTGDDLVGALETMGGEIRERIGEAVGHVRRDPPLQQVTTPSLEALRLYTEASRLNTLDAVPLLERAVALDTTFAMAYRSLESALNSYITQWDRQQEYARKAYEYRDHLTEYQRLLVEADYLFQRIVNGHDPRVPNPTECDLNEPMLHLYEAYVARHPEDPRPLQNYGFYLERTGHPERAVEAYRRLVTADPSNNGGFHNLYVAYLKAARYVEAREARGWWQRQLAGADPWRLHLADVEMLARLGDYEAADSAATLYDAARASDPDVPGMEGELDAVRGRMHDASRHFAAGIRRMEQTGNAELPVPLIATWATIRLVALGDTAGALADLNAAVDRLPPGANLSGGWVRVGLVYALAGDTTAARKALDAMVNTGRGRWDLTTGVLGAAVALAKGEPRRSLELEAKASGACYLAFGGAHPYRRIIEGRAQERLGRVDLAIAAYEAYFGDPPVAYPGPYDAAFRFDTLERLGRLYETAGDGARAATYYARAADLWKDADPELQGRVQALKTKAAALEDHPSPQTSAF